MTSVIAMTPSQRGLATTARNVFSGEKKTPTIRARRFGPGAGDAVRVSATVCSPGERRQGVPVNLKERRQGVPVDLKERRQGVPVDPKERRQGVPVDADHETPPSMAMV